MPIPKALKFLKTSVRDLIQTKQKIWDTEKFQQMNEDDMYQKAMQKLENEIRSHIKSQHQLKLFVENLEGKLEEN